MAAEAKQIVIEDIWRGLYGESWKGLICDEAFAHPAKFSRALIRKIYDHVIEEGWAKSGDRVIDPFGGVALGAFDAMRHGLYWHGCELEEKFVGLGNGNIALWNERFSRMPNWGTARLIQGDSRKLAEALSATECCISSPPYTAINVAEARHLHFDEARRARSVEQKQREGVPEGYGNSEGQLGAMKEGDHSLVVSSPPYVGIAPEPSNKGIDYEKQYQTYRSQGGGTSFEKFVATQQRHSSGYGKTEGQLGAMPEGQLSVTSPPYNPPMSQDHNGTRGGQRGTTPSEKGAFVKYGNSDGQLEGMPMDGFNAAISSPPYEGIQVRSCDENHSNGVRDVGRHGGKGFTDVGGGTFASEAQLSAQTPETFWSASRLILQQLRQVMVPGGHAVFVVKAFVRDKQIVDFPGQWAQLCEAVGFRLLHHHRASLVEHSGTQRGFEEDKEITVERKSFFRRLAEKKGSPRIDHESVLCFERP